MVKTCCVRDCKTINRRTCGLSWFSVPHLDKIQREKWLKFIFNVDETPAELDEKKIKNWQVCSFHFEPNAIQRQRANGGTAQRARLRIGAVPTIRSTFSGKRMLPETCSAEESEPHTKTQRMDVEVNLRTVVHELRQARKDHEIPLLEQGRIKQENEKFKQEIKILKEENEKLKQDNETLLVQKEECRKLKDLQEEMKSMFTENQLLKSQILQLESKSVGVKTNLEQEMAKCKKLQDDLEASKFRYNNLKQDSRSFQYFSGFTVERFETLFDFLGGEACEDFVITRTKIVKPKVAKFPLYPNLAYHKPGPPRELSARDQLFMVLCRLRLHHGLVDLGSRFKVSQALVSYVCSAWIPNLKKRFLEAGIWHEGNESKYQSAPEHLKPLYQKIKLLIEGIKKVEDDLTKRTGSKKATEKSDESIKDTSSDEGALTPLEETSFVEFLNSSAEEGAKV